MRILITGSNGQLGNELQKIVSTGKAEIGAVSEEIKNAEVFAMDVNILDITNLEQVKKVLNEVKPDVVINCAAATNVDGCEANQDLAFKINSLGPRNLAMVAEELGAKIVQVSTDYVFSGVGEAPLKECDLVAPVSVYGKTKLLGEEFVRDFSTKYYIVRTAWLYGYVGHNFVYTMMKLIQTEEYGVYHCTGKGECSWYNFASEIMKLSGRNCTVNPCTSEEYKSMYPNSADRPAYSSLDNMMLRCTIGDEMRDWKDALKTFMDNVEK